MGDEHDELRRLADALDSARAKLKAGEPSGSIARDFSAWCMATAPERVRALLDRIEELEGALHVAHMAALQGGYADPDESRIVLRAQAHGDLSPRV